MASRRRSVLLERLAQVGRANSDATVLFHATVAKLLGLHPSDEKTMSVLQRLGPRMFPLTLSGVAKGIDALRH